MKERLMALWAKALANKQVLIKAGGAVAGAAIGMLVTAYVANTYEESQLPEELDDSIEEFDYE